MLDDILKAKDKYSKKKAEKMNKVEVERLRKDTLQLISTLNEYAQRGKVEFAKKKPKKK